jgi:hypothetical protein
MSNEKGKSEAKNPWGKPIVLAGDSSEAGAKLKEKELCCPVHSIEYARTAITVREQVREKATLLLESESLGYTILPKPILTKDFPPDEALSVLMELNSPLKISRREEGGFEIRLQTAEATDRARGVLESRSCTLLPNEEGGPIIVASRKSEEIKAQLEFELEGSFEANVVEPQEAAFIPLEEFWEATKAELEKLNCAILPAPIITKNLPTSETFETLAGLGSSLKISRIEGDGFKIYLRTESARAQAKEILEEQGYKVSPDEEEVN